MLWFQGPGIVHAGSLSQCHNLLEHMNRTKPPCLSKTVIDSHCLSLLMRISELQMTNEAKTTTQGLATQF